MRRRRDSNELITCKCGVKRTSASRCRSCAVKYGREYRKKNAEVLKIKGRIKYWIDPEKARRVKRESAKRTSRKIQLRNKRWYAANPGHWNKYRIRKRKTWADYAKRNPEKLIDRRIRRKARAKGCKIIEKFSRKEIYVRDQGLCRYCYSTLPETGWHLDHITPLARKGNHTRENVVASCTACNLTKGPNVWIPNPILELV